MTAVQSERHVRPIFTGATPDECWPLIKRFHYSRRLPGNIQHCFAFRHPGGLFGDFGEPFACIMFSIPPTRWSEDVLELTRLVRDEATPVALTGLVASSCNWLKVNGFDLLVSFADSTQGHHGGIYQACSWNYDGKRDPAMDGITIDGVFKPGRSCNSTWGTRSPDRLRELLPNRTIEPHYDEGKHLYWRSLSKLGKKKAAAIGLSSNPYPKPDHDHNSI